MSDTTQGQPVAEEPAPAIVTANVCRKCKFAFYPKQGAAAYECRRFPPTVAIFMQRPAPGSPGPQFVTPTAYPLVQGHNFCGEFVPRLAI